MILGLVIALLFSMVIIFRAIHENSELRENLTLANKTIRQLKNDLYYYQSQYKRSQRIRENAVNDKDIISAVRIAMKASHPDNGGTAEDFIKYRNLYNHISGGR